MLLNYHVECGEASSQVLRDHSGGWVSRGGDKAALRGYSWSAQPCPACRTGPALFFLGFCSGHSVPPSGQCARLTRSWRTAVLHVQHVFVSFNGNLNSQQMWRTAHCAKKCKSLAELTEKKKKEIKNKAVIRYNDGYDVEHSPPPGPGCRTWPHAQYPIQDHVVWQASRSFVAVKYVIRLIVDEGISGSTLQSAPSGSSVSSSRSRSPARGQELLPVFVT